MYIAIYIANIQHTLWNSIPICVPVHFDVLKSGYWNVEVHDVMMGVSSIAPCSCDNVVNSARLQKRRGGGRDANSDG